MSDEEQASSTNLEAILQLFRRTEGVELDKAEQAKVALALTDGWNRDRSTIPESTRDTARQLAEALNRNLDLRPG